MASRATSRLSGGMGGASQYDREPAGFGGYGSERDRPDDDPVDRILTSLDRLGERIRTLSPPEERRPAPRQTVRAAGPDDLQRAIDQISRKREALDPGRGRRHDEADVAELGARVRALSQEMGTDRRRMAPAFGDGLATEVADLRAEVERLVEASAGRSLESAFDTLVARLDDIRTSVDNPRVVGDLVQRLAEIRRLIATLPSGEQVGVITARLDRLAERLDQGLGDQRVLGDFGRSLSDLAAAVAQLDKREVITAIERRLDDVAGSIRAIERDIGDFSRWQEGLERQNAMLSQVAQRSEQLPRVAHEMERQSASIERIARSTDDLPRLAEEIDGLRLSLDRPGVALDAAAIRALDERFAELGRSLEAQLRPAAGAALPADLSAALARIEAKLAEPATNGRISEIEDRIAVLTRSVADIDFATGKDVTALENAVERLREDVLAAAGRPDAGLAADVRTLVERIERLDAPSIGAAAFDRLESRIADISSRLETRPIEIAALADALERLDATMSSSLSVEAIADRMAAAADRHGGDAPARLASVEAGINRLGEDLRADAERDRSLLLAIGQTVERLALREAGGDEPTIEAEQKAPHPAKDNWEEIQQALTRRMPPITEAEEEEDLPRIFGRKSAPAPRVEPSLGKPEQAKADEPALPPGFDINKPLEPGSGKPRLPKSSPATDRTATADAARAPTKADFIAAARRAAQAAGSGIPGETSKEETPAAGRSRFALPKFDLNLRKLAMVVAVVLIALGLVKIANDTLQRFSASSNAPAEAVSSSEATAPATASPEAPTATAPPAEPSPASAPANEAVPSSISPVTGEIPSAPQTPMPSEGFSQTPPALPTNGFAPVPTVTSAPPISPDAAVETPASPVTEAAPTLPEAIGPQALRDAATGGNPLAAVEVAARYADGRGVPQDLTAAINWYRRAAEAGLAPAQYRLGSLYEKGTGTARNAKTATEWYAKAAALGNAKAMHNLAVINAEGSLGAPDYAMAAKWFQEAAERGIRDSQFNLGILYARGLGVPRDLATSYKWFALAATAGDTDSAKKRDDIAQVLSKEDLARARLAVETWVAKPLDPKAEEVPPADPAWAEAPEHTASVDTSRTIARTQAILSSLGFDAGPPDGKLGRKTRDAIAAFQTSKGLPATGEVDKALVEALGMPTL